MIYNNSFPIGVKPLMVVWHFENADHSPYALNGFDLSLVCRSTRSEVEIDAPMLSGDGTSLSFTLPEDKQKFVGSYSLHLKVTDPSTEKDVCELTYNRAFTLIPSTEDNDIIYEEGDGANVVNIYTIANYTMFSNVPYITAGSDGFLKSDGETMLDGDGVPVRWKPNIVVVDEIPSAEDAEESVIYRKIEGQSYTDYALTEGDVSRLSVQGGPWSSGADFVYNGEGDRKIDYYTSEHVYFWATNATPSLRMYTKMRNPVVGGDFFYDGTVYCKVGSVYAEPDVVAIESGRLLSLEARVSELKADTDSRFDNLSAEEVAYEGLVYANNVKDALNNLQSYKVSNQELNVVRESVNDLREELGTKASQTEVSSIQSTLGRHSSRMDTIDANLGSLDAGKADKTQLSPINSALSEHTQKIYEVTTKVNNLSANQVQYSGKVMANNVKEALDNLSQYKASQSTVDTLEANIRNRQEKLVSGENIKTINGQPILGSGNIEIQGGGGSEVIEIPYVNSTTDQAIIREVCLALAANPNGKFVVVEDNKRRNVVYIDDISNPSTNFHQYYITVADDSRKWLEQILLFGTDGSAELPQSFWGANNTTIRDSFPSTSGLQQTTYRQDVLTSSKTNYPSSKGVIDYVSGQLSPINTALAQKIGKPTINTLLSTDILWLSLPYMYNVCDTPLTSDANIAVLPYTASRAEEVIIRFSVAEGATPTLTWADNITAWVGGAPTIEGGKTYLVSIQDGIGIIVEV